MTVTKAYGKHTAISHDTNTHAHATHIHTHKHTHPPGTLTHTYMHTHAYTHTHTHLHAHTYLHTHTCAHTYRRFGRAVKGFHDGLFFAKWIRRRCEEVCEGGERARVVRVGDECEGGVRESVCWG